MALAGQNRHQWFVDLEGSNAIPLAVDSFVQSPVVEVRRQRHVALVRQHELDTLLSGERAGRGAEHGRDVFDADRLAVVAADDGLVTDDPGGSVLRARSGIVLVGEFGNPVRGTRTIVWSIRAVSVSGLVTRPTVDTASKDGSARREGRKQFPTVSLHSRTFSRY